MLIAVKSCEQHWDRCSAIRETWGASPLVQFFTGNFLHVRDEYEYLPHKTNRICRWALSHGQESLFLCDTDTYVAIPRLLLVDRLPYTGYKLEGKNYASGGAGYLLCREAIAAVAEANPSKYAFEDQMVGEACENADIHLWHDSRFSLYNDPLPENEIISRHLSSRKPFEIPMMHEAHRRFLDRRD